MSVADTIDDLRRRGFELIPDPPAIRVRHVSREVAETARPLLEELRARKDEALEILTAAPDAHTWDEEHARRRIEEAWRWGGQSTPGGCWSALPDDIRADLQAELDTAFDTINRAFTAKNPAALESGFLHFRRTVEAAVAEYERDEESEP